MHAVSPNLCAPMLQSPWQTSLPEVRNGNDDQQVERHSDHRNKAYYKGNQNFFKLRTV